MQTNQIIHNVIFLNAITRMGIVWPVKINFLLLKGRFGFFRTIKNMLLFVGLKFNSRVSLFLEISMLHNYYYDLLFFRHLIMFIGGHSSRDGGMFVCNCSKLV